MPQVEEKHVLILLVGSNPLPNFVVAGYLMKAARSDTSILPVPNRFVLLHSNKTADLARQLSAQLNITSRSYLANLGDDEHNRSAIIKVLTRKVDEIGPRIKTIHLNYTGGRKTMAVHSYFMALKHNNIRRIFTYLNSDSFKLMLDESGHSFPTSGDLRDEVKISIKDLLTLHLMDYKSGEENMTFADRVNIDCFATEILQDRFSGACWLKKFDKLKNHEKLIKDKFKKKCESIPLGVVHKKNADGSIKASYNGINEFNKNGFFENIDKALPALSCFFHDGGFRVDLPDSQETFKRLIHFVHGLWLEDYIMYVLMDLKKDKKIKYDDIQKSVYAAYNGRLCEVDILVMRGYQMFLISCTTDGGIGRVKQKAFEALFRSEQLGGDHAQAVVVSCLPNQPTRPRDENNLEELNKDLQSYDARQRFDLIGIDELKNLTELKKRICTIFTMR